MTPSLFDLQASIQDNSAFGRIEDYYVVCDAFLNFLKRNQPTRIVSPNDHRYIFYQYSKVHDHKITRPLNSDLYIESPIEFQVAFERFMIFLADLRKIGRSVDNRRSINIYLKTNEVNKIVYTAQQSIGSIGDSLENPNQSRKRIGQLFENFVKLLIQEIGFICESRTITVPIPDFLAYDIWQL